MKKPKDAESYFFVDEAGDPNFFGTAGGCIVGKIGCSSILILGFIETQDPEPLRKAILKLHDEAIEDKFLRNLSSARKTKVSFHANCDGAEVRYLVYSLLRTLDFKAQFVVVRKIESVFRQRYRCKQNKFYDDLVTRLFQNNLHRFKTNEIVFSKRGSRARKKPLEHAIWKAKHWFQSNHAVPHDSTAFDVRSHRPSGEPCLCIIDYMNWALYWAFVDGDTRYYDFVKPKISFIRTRDLPELGSTLYDRKRPLDLKKAAPLGLGP